MAEWRPVAANARRRPAGALWRDGADLYVVRRAWKRARRFTLTRNDSSLGVFDTEADARRFAERLAALTGENRGDTSDIAEAHPTASAIGDQPGLDGGAHPQRPPEVDRA